MIRDKQDRVMFLALVFLEMLYVLGLLLVALAWLS